MSRDVVALVARLTCVQLKDGVRVRCEVTGMVQDRYTTLAIATLDLGGAELPEDPEELVSLALGKMSEAVYHS